MLYTLVNMNQCSSTTSVACDIKVVLVYYRSVKEAPTSSNCLALSLLSTYVCDFHVILIFHYLIQLSYEHYTSFQQGGRPNQYYQNFIICSYYALDLIFDVQSLFLMTITDLTICGYYVFCLFQLLKIKVKHYPNK